MYSLTIWLLLLVIMNLQFIQGVLQYTLPTISYFKQISNILRHLKNYAMNATYSPPIFHIAIIFLQDLSIPQFRF